MPTDRRKATSEDLKNEVLAKIQHYADKDFKEAPKIHEIIMQANPSLCPRLWYGMPGYAKTKDSAVLCFFSKDTLVYFGVTEFANMEALSDGESTVAGSWYVTELDSDAEAKIRDVVVKATR